MGEADPNQAILFSDVEKLENARTPLDSFRQVFSEAFSADPVFCVGVREEMWNDLAD